MARHLRIIAVSAVALAISSRGALAQNRVGSTGAASQILIAFAQKHHLAPNDSRPGKYYCDPSPRQRPFFIIALRRIDEKAPSDQVMSDLVGWYGIDERDGSIVEWNIDEGIPGKKISGQVKKPQK